MHDHAVPDDGGGPRPAPRPRALAVYLDGHGIDNGITLLASGGFDQLNAVFPVPTMAATTLRMTFMMLANDALVPRATANGSRRDLRLLR